MPKTRKTTDVPHFTRSERAVLIALVQRREATATALATATRLSLITTQRALRRFELLGAAVRFSGATIDGRSARAFWSASTTVVDLLTKSGVLPMAQALSAPSARDKVLTALGLRPGMTIGDIAWATGLSRSSVTQVVATLEKQEIASRIERRRSDGARHADGWMLALDLAADPLFEL